eukprot:600552-Pleurochrysis_carterae.AAC.1
MITIVNYVHSPHEVEGGSRWLRQNSARDAVYECLTGVVEGDHRFHQRRALVQGAQRACTTARCERRRAAMPRDRERAEMVRKIVEVPGCADRLDSVRLRDQRVLKRGIARIPGGRLEGSVIWGSDGVEGESRLAEGAGSWLRSDAACVAAERPEGEAARKDARASAWSLADDEPGEDEKALDEPLPEKQGAKRRGGFEGGGDGGGEEVGASERVAGADHRPCRAVFEGAATEGQCPPHAPSTGEGGDAVHPSRPSSAGRRLGPCRTRQ